MNAGTANIYIYDLFGKIVLAKKGVLDYGVSQHSIPLNELPAGLYLLESEGAVSYKIKLEKR